MRVFLSRFDNYFIAIPTAYIASIMIYRENHDNKSSFISLPRIFNIQNQNTRHGLILKNSNYILLTTRVDSETIIPKEKLYSLPKTLGSLESSRVISSIKFIQDQLVLVLNPEQLVKNIEKEIL